MKLMRTLALRHLIKNRKQTMFSLIAITLSVALLTGVGGITYSTYDAFAQMLTAMGKDIDRAISSVRPMITSIAAFLSILIMAASIVVITNAFSISVAERVKQFGIIKSVGATRQQIRSTVMHEGLFLCLVGIPLGIAVGFGMTWVGAALANQYLGSWNFLNEGVGDLNFRVLFFAPAVFAAMVLSYITVMLSAWRVARKVNKLSAIEAIKQSDEVGVSPGKMRSSKLIQTIFGFEGTLAAKSLKRAKRKYRATVVSLVTSIVLVLISATFGSLMMKTLEILYPDPDRNVQITGYELTSENADAYSEELKQFTEIKFQRIIASQYELTAYPSDYQPSMRNGKATVFVVSPDDDIYNELCKMTGVDYGSIILLGDTNVRFDKSQMWSFRDDSGNSFNFYVSSQSREITEILRQVVSPNLTTVVFPPDYFREKGLVTNALWYVWADDPYAFCEQAEIAFADAGDQLQIRNATMERENIKQIYNLVMIFIFSFIAMLTAIGVTSVLATINSNIALRTPEFAVLQAVGMDSGGLRRMLNLESLLYGLKSLLIGVPLGVVLSFALYRLFSLEVNFEFEIPWLAVGLCVLGTFAITFISMRYASSKLRRSNIAEAMRAVNI